MQFTVKIIYSDDSSILLNSIEDFNLYKEVQPLTSIGVVLSWTYLIKFKNKDVFEKQEIDLAFRSDISPSNFIFEDGIEITKRRRYFPDSSITLRISHTDRTWGTDIESLVSGYVKTLKIEENKVKNYIRKKSGWIGLLVFALMFLSGLFTIYVSTSKMANTYYSKLEETNNATTDINELLIEKINLLTNIFIKSTWPKYSVGPQVFIFILLVISMFFGIFISIKANTNRHSFVLLSKAAEEHEAKRNKKTRRDWYMFFISLISGIITGIVSNLLFYIFFIKTS